MSGTFPTSPKPKDSKLISNQPVYSVIGDSGKRQARILGGHLWYAKLNYPVMTRAQFAPIFGFCAKQRGGSFQIQIAPHSNAQGTISGAVLTNGAAAAGAELLMLDGLGATDTFLAGDCFTLATHSKVYMVVDDAVATLGVITVNITPPLIEDVADNTALTYNGVQFTMAFKDSPQELKVTRPTHASYSVDLVEATT